MSRYGSWRQPRCLVDDQGDGSIGVNAATMDALSRVTDPLDVVCILGGYRTGKSYLMNWLANAAATSNDAGFAMSATIEAKTKGIWIWCVPHPKVKGRCLALMDTEGLGDPMKGDNDHDVWICVLAVLLSQTLIYNSVGTIDENVLQHLDFVTKMAHHIKVKAGQQQSSSSSTSSATPDDDNDDDDEESLIAQLCPQFVWPVRDFTLQLDLDGKQATPDEYLERCLQEKPGESRKMRGFNRIRRGIKRFFPSRRCFVLPLPTTDSAALAHVERLSDSQLSPAFVAAVRDLSNFVLDCTSGRSIAGRAMDGAMFSSMADCYVASVRRGDVPCVESALRTTAERENVRAVERSVAVYERLMTEQLDASPADSVQAFVAAHDRSEREATTTFTGLVIFDTDGSSRQQLDKELASRREHYRRMNESAAKRKCELELRTLYTPVNSALQDGNYLKPGGYQDYLGDKKTFRKAYLGDGRGYLGREVLQEFLASTAATEKFIRSVDDKLTESSQKYESERRSLEAQHQSSREIKAQLIKTSTQLEQTHIRSRDEQSEIQRLQQVVTSQRDVIKELAARLVAANVPVSPALVASISSCLETD